MKTLNSLSDDNAGNNFNYINISCNNNIKNYKLKKTMITNSTNNNILSNYNNDINNYYKEKKKELLKKIKINKIKKKVKNMKLLWLI